MVVERVRELRPLRLLLFACLLVLALLLPASLCVCVRVCAGPTMTSQPPRTRPIGRLPWHAAATAVLGALWLFAALAACANVPSAQRTRLGRLCVREARLRASAASSRALKRYSYQSLAGRTSSRGPLHGHQWPQLAKQHQLAQWRSLQPEVVWCLLLERHCRWTVRCSLGG